ncbi:MAG: HAD family hydrolase [Clostridiales bacterium]|nr:HAD family hydrolase [Clostridiales bacterium]
MATLKETITFKNNVDRIIALIASAYENDKTVFVMGEKKAAKQISDKFIIDCGVHGRNGIKSISVNAACTKCSVRFKTLAGRGDILITLPCADCSDSINSITEYALSRGVEVVSLCEGDDIDAVFCGLKARLEDMWGIEVLRRPKNKFKIALFDFDGTLSLIRQGWQEIMTPYFTEVLMNTPKGKEESYEELSAIAREFIDRLTGKQTIFQCIELDEQVVKRGGEHVDPMVYKNEYLRRLMERIADRRNGLANNTINPTELLVKGSEDFLQALIDEGFTIYLASGTDEPQVKEEAHLLGVDRFFGENIYGARDEHATECTKEIVIRRIIKENNIDPAELISFGDGYVELELVRNIDGFAVAVATNEERHTGIDEWKRKRLTAADACAVIPDFERTDKLMNFIMGRD